MSRNAAATQRFVIEGFLESYAVLRDEQRVLQARRSMLTSLRFPEMHLRYDSVSEAQRNTFSWIVDSDQVSQQHSSNIFREWLLDSRADANGVFWLSGKPGSGKSTLMRFLVNDKRLLQLVQIWAGHNDVVIVKVFFWNAGSYLQKSQQGLLRSILFQMLSCQKRLINGICDTRLAHLLLDSKHESEWTLQELDYGIRALVRIMGMNTRIFMIIDGLDEYLPDDTKNTWDEGRAICDLLHELGKHPSVKTCASSRPWEVYRVSFKGTPSLRLEDLTRNDIMVYVRDVLGAEPQFRVWKQQQAIGADCVITSVVERAQGVFFWVHLVVKSLIQGLRNNDELHELQDRLDQIPSDLTKYFQHIMSSLDKDYLERASQFFAVVSCAIDPLPLLSYHFVVGPVAKAALQDNRSMYELDEIDRLEEKEEKRLNATTMGLLEVTNRDSEWDRWPPYLKRVDFMHRTVFDFCQTEEVQEQLRMWRSPCFDANFALLRSTVCLIHVQICHVNHYRNTKSHLSHLSDLSLEYSWRAKATECEITTC